MIQKTSKTAEPKFSSNGLGDFTEAVRTKDTQREAYLIDSSEIQVARWSLF